MNAMYCLVWSESRQCWLVTHEAAKARGKKSALRTQPLLTVLIGGLLSQGSLAAGSDVLPTGGQVVSGQASMSQSGNSLTIRQSSDKAILNWNSFSIGAGASVNFQQPSSSAVALNRVVGNEASAIYGSLTANGQVFLINPRGVLFGQGAHVDVGGLVASTMSLRDEDFLVGNYRFVRDGATGDVRNQGELLGHYIALLAPEVRNEGVIVASQGTVVMAAGESVTLSLTGNSLIDVQVESARLATLVENRHVITAEGGTVILSAQSAQDLLGSVVNSGEIEARGLINDGGTVRLMASSSVEHSGSIDVSAGETGHGGKAILLADTSNANARTKVSGSIAARGGRDGGDGGFVETSAYRVMVGASAHIDTSAAHGRVGSWLIDPVSFTVAASGGDMTGATLRTQLTSTDVTLTATCAVSANCNPNPSVVDGDIFINDTVRWGSGHTLTLSADRAIYINAPIDATYDTATGTGTGKLELRFGQSDFASNFPAGNFFVSAPITLAAGNNFTTVWGRADGTGFDAPVVDTYTVVTDKSSLAAITTNDSNARYVLGNDIDAAGGWTPIGSIASPYRGYFDGLGHTVSNISASNTANEQYVGLFGALGNSASVQNLGILNANVAGLSYVGALAGSNAGSLYNVYASGGTVTGSDVVGSSTDDNVFAIGGLVGSNSGPVHSAYANVTVTASSGNQSTGSMTNGGIGGLVGFNDGSITDTHAAGNVTGIGSVGGLVGTTMGSVGSSYASGSVSGSGNVGGVIGELFNQFMQPLLFDTYWISDNGASSSASDGWNASTRISTVNAEAQASWSGFDFSNNKTWLIREGESHPLLTSMLQKIFVYAGDTSQAYSGSAVTSTSATVSAGTATGSDYSGTATATPTTTALNVGSYTVTPTGLTLTNPNAQLGYRLVTTEGTLTITQRAITLSATSTSKVYGDADGSLAVSVSSGSLGSGDTLADVAGTLTRQSGESVGSYDIALGSGSKASNYAITFSTNNDAFGITQRPITLSASSASKVYGNADPTLGVSVTSGSLGSASVSDTLADVTGTLSRQSGENVGNYDIALGSGSKASNYAITFVTDNNALGITQRPITLTATPVNKTSGQADPALAVSITSGSLGSVSVSDTLADVTGTLTRQSGESVGSYDVALGSGSKASNYAITFATNNNAFTIAPQPSVQPSQAPGIDPIANAQGHIRNVISIIRNLDTRAAGGDIKTLAPDMSPSTPQTLTSTVDAAFGTVESHMVSETDISSSESSFLMLPTDEPVTVFIAAVVPNGGGTFLRDSAGHWVRYTGPETVVGAASAADTRYTIDASSVADMKAAGARIYLGYASNPDGVNIAQAFNTMLANKTFKKI